MILTNEELDYLADYYLEHDFNERYTFEEFLQTYEMTRNMDRYETKIALEGI